MAKAPQSPAGAEIIPDVDAGGQNAGTPPGEVNEMGLTAEEQAEFDRMAAGGDDGSDADAGTGAGDADPPGDDPADPPGDDPADDAGDQGDPADRTDAEGEPSRAAGKSTPKTVSYSKYQRELDKARKQAKTEAERRAQVEADHIRATERLRIINEALAAQAAPAPAAGDPPADEVKNPFEEEDIDATVDYAAAADQLNRRLKFSYEQQQQVASITDEDRQDREIRETYTRDATRYAATEEGKHFPEAYAYLKDLRLRQIGVAQFGKDPQDTNSQWTEQEVNQLVQIFNNEEKYLVANAIRRGISPAAAIMQQANLLRFEPTPPTPAPAASPTPTPAAAAPTAAKTVPATAKTPNGGVAAEIAALAKNRDDGRSLSDGGSVPADGLTMESLLKMNDDEFAEFVDTLPSGKLDAIMGRPQI